MSEVLEFNGEKAKQLIKAKGFRNSAVADYCGIKHRSLNSYLNGFGRPSLSVMRLMAQKLGCSEDDLVNRNVDPINKLAS